MGNVDGTTQKKLNELALRIRDARRNAHLSQEELGQYIGVSDKSISAYEQSRSTPPISKLKKIAEATSHPLSYFTQEENIEAILASKLANIERELAEVKDLLKEKVK
ncbi:MAG TPA: helix-turn-helix transcriptional regulator [Patescibacteria group bacterium]|nr:helix-turn-helix transcriptional regulator [Patescibacteria group bacterium]